MATVTGLTKDRMLAIEAASVVGGEVDASGNLILETHGGGAIDAGHVKGDKGDKGDGSNYPIGTFTNNSVTNYVRLGILNGIDVQNGASLQFLISGIGGIGASARATVLVHAGQRGSSAFPQGPVHIRAWSWGLLDTASGTDSIKLYTKKLPTNDFDYEIWARFSSYTMASNITLMAAWRSMLLIDSKTTTIPTDLVEWPITDMVQTKGSGTTSERDRIYPTPTTDPERVILANRRVTWYNTDLGWEESYYATTGKVGLVATGLAAGLTSGWYPIGKGPRISLVANAAQQMSTGAVYINWAQPGTGESWRNCDDSWFTSSGVGGLITAVKAGRYRIRISMQIQDGSGSGAFGLSLNGVQDTLISPAITTVTLTPSLGHLFIVESPDIPLAAGTSARLYAVAVTGAAVAQNANGLRRGRGEFTMEYLGPNLVGR